jgi:hypothetical protein
MLIVISISFVLLVLPLSESQRLCCVFTEPLEDN